MAFQASGCASGGVVGGVVGGGGDGSGSTMGGGGGTGIPYLAPKAAIAAAAIAMIQFNHGRFCTVGTPATRFRLAALVVSAG